MTDREEFERARKHLYALADRLGMKLTIIVRRAPTPKAQPFTKGVQGKREPGDE